jgi:RNA polymerase sigma-70 factor (ECF subfamily)
MERYLFTVAGNALKRKRSRDGRWTELGDEQSLLPPDELSPERIVLSRERLGSAVAVIAKLPPRTRQVFMLHRFEEMTYRRISQKLGISVSAVEKHIMNALRAIMNDGGR